MNLKCRVPSFTNSTYSATSSGSMFELFLWRTIIVIQIISKLSHF